MQVAWARDPPTDWLAAAYMKYTPPAWAKEPRTRGTWSKAIENTKAMYNYLTQGSKPKT